MILENDNKLKRRMPTMISSAKAIIILSLALLFTYVAFVNLSQPSFAQTTNTNQTSSSAAQSQPKTLTTPCKLTESTAQGPEYKEGPPFRQGQDFAKGLQGPRLEKWKGIEYGYM